MRGSAAEVKAMVSPQAYVRMKAMFAKKDWCIVGFSADTFILRIERENIEFDRRKGTIKQRYKL